MWPRKGRLRVGLALVVLAACGASDGAQSDGAQSDGAQSDGAQEDRRPVAGFGEVAFEVESSEGERHAGCALLAATEAQRSRGLMGRTDLSGYDGMLFQFTSETTSGFWMRNTPLPLSIAWFDTDGRFVSAADMTPCGDRDTCPLYHPTGPYRIAFEVPQGGLDELGMVPGSVLAVTGERCAG